MLVPLFVAAVQQERRGKKLILNDRFIKTTRININLSVWSFGDVKRINCYVAETVVEI